MHILRCVRSIRIVFDADLTGEQNPIWHIFGYQVIQNVWRIEKLMANENTYQWKIEYTRFFLCDGTDAQLLSCVRNSDSSYIFACRTLILDYLHIQRDFYDAEQWFRWDIVRKCWFSMCNMKSLFKLETHQLSFP